MVIAVVVVIMTVVWAAASDEARLQAGQVDTALQTLFKIKLITPLS